MTETKDTTETRESQSKTIAKIESLVDGFEFCCLEHGQNCKPDFTGDDLKALAASHERQAEVIRVLLEAVKHYAREKHWDSYKGHKYVCLYMPPMRHGWEVARVAIEKVKESK